MNNSILSSYLLSHVEMNGVIWAFEIILLRSDETDLQEICAMDFIINCTLCFSNEL